ncbi:MAG: NAD(P)/FAD-dependent oxidoreductase, partial [Candidatus Binatia bacterium]
LHTSAANFLSANPDFCRSALARYTPRDFVALVDRHGIAHHEKKLGQLFCDGSAREIIRMLLDECAAARVEVLCGREVTEITRDTAFVMRTERDVFTAGSLVLATGGLSIPKIGATDFAYRTASRFGLRVVPPRPALVPLLFGTEDSRAFGDLSGVSFEALVRLDGAAFREGVLITHRGLSGPAILQISSHWREGAAVHLDLLPGDSGATLLEAAGGSNKELATLLGQRLPRRFAQTWCSLYAASKPIRQYSTKEIGAIGARLHDWRVVPAATEGFAKAEVTAGGIDTGELSSKTMQARRVPGLYAIGEAVDVTGELGGFNFQWAWASGYAAGQYV